MTGLRWIIMASAFLFCLFSCDKTEDRMRKPQSFKASTESPFTKTVLDTSGTLILWQTSDRINIFCGKSSTFFTAQYTDTPSLTTVFSGYWLDGHSDIADNNVYWAVYPYAEANSFDGQSISVSVPDVQTASEMSFDKNSFVMIAKSENDELCFKNLCGGVAVSVSGYQLDRISTIELISNGGEPIAGTVIAQFDEDGFPVVQEIVNGKSSITLQNKSRFEQGKWYYISAIPQTLSQGYTLRFTAGYDSRVFEKEYPAPVSIRRSTWGVLNDADINVTMVPFTDINFFYYCRQYLDYDNDYVISIDEALQVKSISCSNRDINSLSDLSFFSNIVSLYCNNNNLTELDVRANVNLASIDCQNNNIRELNIEGLRNLSYLVCSNNQLTSLNVAGNPDLSVLKCKGNPELREIWISPDQSFKKLEYDSDITTLRYVGITAINLNKTVLTLAEGKEYRLIATIEPEFFAGSTVTWASSDRDVAVVDQSGLVKALKSGQVTITAQSGGKTGTCEVTVKEINPDEDQGEISFDDWKDGETIDF